MKGMRVPETKTGRRDAGSIDEDDAASVLKEADKFRGGEVRINERMLTIPNKFLNCRQTNKIPPLPNPLEKKPIYPDELQQ